MFALTLDFGRHTLSPCEAPEPTIEHDDDVLFAVREVGICGTDRALARFAMGRPPDGEDGLILGHEALGQVESVGRAVRDLSPGDFVAPMIRRPCCGPCTSCDRGRSDLCLTGWYTERGIHGAHGYFSEYAVDSARYLIRIPPEMSAFAVLMEPLSVVEKAVETALRACEGAPRNAVILGAGAIGILTALALLARGIAVTVKSLEAETDPRVSLLKQAGADYVRGNPPQADLVFEATGAAEAGFEAVRLLAPCGVAVILGAMNGYGDLPFHDLVVGNRKIIGVVNAPRLSFEAAAEDLRRFGRMALDALIERRPRAEVVDSLFSLPSSGASQAVKLVHTLKE